MFVFFLQYIMYNNLNLIKIFFNFFVFLLNDVFSFRKNLFLRRLISLNCFLFLLLCCYGGYFSYSFRPCGIIEFTLFLSLIS